MKESKYISRKVRATLSAKTEKRVSERHKLSAKPVEEDYSRVLFRVNVNKYKQIRIKTNCIVPVSQWCEKEENVKNGEARMNIAVLKTKIERLLELYATEQETITKEWLELVLSLTEDVGFAELSKTLVDDIIDKHLNPDNHIKLSFFELWEQYLKETKYTAIRERNMRVIIRALMRYEWFIKESKDKDFTLDVDTITKDTIYNIEDYLRNEHLLLEKYPHIFETIPANTEKRAPKKPKPRGDNTIYTFFGRFRAFFSWCFENGITTNRPFVNYNGVKEKYGTPYYITQEERNLIAEFDLSAHPALEIQRDIFVFQCMIGCRVSDLMRLTNTDIIDGAVCYVPRKTKENNPVTVKVPIKGRAETLLNKYKGVDKSGKIFPFISSQKYNDAIKEIFKVCGITRAVTVLNTLTGEEEKRPINEVASSHMARRTFVGNLYKRVKDPNIISSMSGHKPGSSAFARYREIDMDIKTELIDLLNE